MGKNSKCSTWITPDGLLKIKGWARDGLTGDQIAKNIGISLSTLYEWRKKYPDMMAALEQGKEVADREVENALFKSALGYEIEETCEELRFNRKTGQNEMVVTKRTKKKIPPNVTAQIFWLKNRKPREWRDKREVEMSGELQTNPFAGLTDEQLRKLAKSDD